LRRFFIHFFDNRKENIENIEKQKNIKKRKKHKKPQKKFIFEKPDFHPRKIPAILI
jgi:hypothetical protein